MAEINKRYFNHKFSLQQRIELIKIFYSGKSLKKTAREFADRHPELQHTPTASGITRLVKKFEATGSVQDKPIPGRPKSDFYTIQTIQAIDETTDPTIEPKVLLTEEKVMKVIDSESEQVIEVKVKKSGNPLPKSRLNDSVQCDWPGCGYVSSRKCLARHRLVHMSERNFICQWPHCDKKFKSNLNLRNHMRIHYGDKRYACSWPGCKYRCVDSGNIRKHKKIHEKHFENLLKSTEFSNTSVTAVKKSDNSSDNSL